MQSCSTAAGHLHEEAAGRQVGHQPRHAARHRARRGEGGEVRPRFLGQAVGAEPGLAPGQQTAGVAANQHCHVRVRGDTWLFFVNTCLV